MRAGWTNGMVIGALALSAAIAGCVRRVETASPEARPVRVIARASGGIGALDVVRIVELDSSVTRWVAFTRRLCDGGGDSLSRCPAATDSAAGHLDTASSTRVWTAVREARLAELRPDYGMGPGADRMSLEVRVVGSDGREHAVRGDESTVPPALARVVETMNAVISAARGAR